MCSFFNFFAFCKIRQGILVKSIIQKPQIIKICKIENGWSNKFCKNSLGKKIHIKNKKIRGTCSKSRIKYHNKIKLITAKTKELCVKLNKNWKSQIQQTANNPKNDMVKTIICFNCSLMTAILFLSWNKQKNKNGQQSRNNRVLHNNEKMGISVCGCGGDIFFERGW